MIFFLIQMIDADDYYDSSNSWWCFVQTEELCVHGKEIGVIYIITPVMTATHNDGYDDPDLNSASDTVCDAHTD